MERVWEVLTRPEHSQQWFGDTATMDPRPGGSAVFGWREYGESQAVIEKADPPHVLSYRWARRQGETPVAGNSTLVEFTLTPHAGGTLLRLVESGFTTVDQSDAERSRHVEENAEGWRIELGELKEYAERAGR